MENERKKERGQKIYNDHNNRLIADFNKVKKTMGENTRVFNISIKSINDEYQKALRRLTDEYNLYKTNQSTYSFLTGNIKNSKMKQTCMKICDEFSLKIYPIVNSDYQTLLDEAEQDEQYNQAKQDKSKQKLEFLKNNIVFKASPKMAKYF